MRRLSLPKPASSARRSDEFYKRYPADQSIVQRIAERRDQGDVYLPSGDLLTVRRFQTLGILLGASDGFEELHYLLEHAFVEHVADDALLERRLLELGFFAGARVEVVATMWPDDDPLAVRIGGATFALRRHEAALVQVDVAARDTGPDA